MNTSRANDTDWSIWSVFVVVRVVLPFLLNGVKADVRLGTVTGDDRLVVDVWTMFETMGHHHPKTHDESVEMLVDTE